MESKITSFDRAKARMVQDRIAAAIEPILKELGLVNSTSGGGSYSSTEVKVNLRIGVADQESSNGLSVSDLGYWKFLASHHGMDPDLIKHWLRPERGRVDFKIVGLRPRATKNMFSIETRNGARYVTGVDYIERASVADRIR